MNSVFTFMINFFLKNIKSVSIDKTNGLFTKQTFFPQETFSFPNVSDILGVIQPFFQSYTYQIPEQYVLFIPYGKCILGREEVFTANNSVIEEITTQKKNPFTGKKFFFHPVKKVKGSVVNLSLSGLEKSYAHFTMEFLLRYYIFLQCDIEPDYYIVDNTLPFQKEIISLLKIPQNKIINTCNKKVIIQADTLITTSLVNNWELVFFDNKAHYQKQWLPSWNKKIYDYLISQVLIKSTDIDKVYISRNHCTKRIIENEEELLTILNKYNFKTFYLENMTVADQISLFFNAKYIIAPHGAALVNLNYCREDTFVLELFPQIYHDSSFKLLSYINKLDYHYLICKTSKLTNEPSNDNINIDLKVLESFLNKNIIKN